MITSAASSSITSNNEKLSSQRKSFDTKLTSDFRKSLESLDEKKTTPPPVLSKKPIVPIKKSPTVSSTAGSIFSGLKQMVKSSDKQSSNDSLDGIGASKSASVSQIADITEKGVVIERMKKDDSDFDTVERSSILQDMRAGRVKAPKRRLPTSSLSFGNSIDNNNSTTYQNGGNSFTTEPLFDNSKPPVTGLPPTASSTASATSDDDSTKPKSRNWEKQKAPWMDELKASQAKKTSPSSAGGDGKISSDIPILQKSHTVDHQNQHQHQYNQQQQQHHHHETSEKFDMSKSFSSSYVSSSSSSSLLTSSSSHHNNKKSIDSSAMESLRSSSSVDIKPIATNIDMITTTPTPTTPAIQHNKRIGDGDIMTKSMSVIATKSNDATPAAISTLIIDDTTNNVKIRPSSVNLKNRSVSPVARMINASSSLSSTQSLDSVCLRVVELEQKVAKLEAIVTVQSKTIEELMRTVKDESDTVKQLRSELDKYAQCVTQV